MTPLIEGIQNFIEDYVFVPSKEASLISAVYVIHTWTYRAAYATPYMYYHSPEKQSGKTKMLTVMSQLVCNPVMSANLTPSSVFRLIEELEPTLIIDEADMLFNGSKNSQMQAVLNSGYLWSGHVLRVGKQGDVEKYHTYGPKIMAGINNLAMPDTIRDRSIPIRMRRKPKNVEIKPFYLRDVMESDEHEHLMMQLGEFSMRSYEALKDSRPQPIKEITDRQWEISEPLVAIADKMGIEDEVRDALIKLFDDASEQQGISDQQQLLIDISQIFREHRVKRISSSDMREALKRGWTGKKLANELACYGVQPKSMRIRNVPCKGYEFEDFKPIFESYL